jgi:hypothetical protein
MSEVFPEQMIVLNVVGALAGNILLLDEQIAENSHEFVTVTIDYSATTCA